MVVAGHHVVDVVDLSAGRVQVLARKGAFYTRFHGEVRASEDGSTSVGVGATTSFQVALDPGRSVAPRKHKQGARLASTTGTRELLQRIVSASAEVVSGDDKHKRVRSQVRTGRVSARHARRHVFYFCRESLGSAGD